LGIEEKMQRPASEIKEREGAEKKKAVGGSGKNRIIATRSLLKNEVGTSKHDQERMENKKKKKKKLNRGFGGN